jgi:hypothetical protein
MADDPIKKLLQQASFSFIGTVVQLGAATMANLPIDDHSAVVQVDHVLDAPPAFANFDGHRVTVQLKKDAAPPAVGQSMAFFTQGVAFGESLAVQEVGRLPVEAVEPQATAALAAGRRAGAFQEIRHAIRREHLQAHAAQGDAVVVGRVTKTEKASQGSASEHDADWWRATIDVSHVERGNVKTGPVEVLYPNSQDVRWHGVPKPAPSSEGVWVLHATTGPLKDAAPYQNLHPDDFQPVDQLDAIREAGR